MNNLVIYNTIRATDKAIKQAMEDTIEVVKHGRPCLQNRCYLGKTGACKQTNGRWHKECLWDMSDLNFDVLKHVRDAEVDRMIRGKEIPRRKPRTAGS